MKKLSILLTLALATVIGTSCTAQAPKAQLKNEVDSLSYAIGVTYSQGMLKQHLSTSMDTAYIKDFIKGFMEGANINKDDKRKNAYMLGLQIGHQIGGSLLDNVNSQFQSMFGDSTKKANKADLLAGFLSELNPQGPKMTMEEAQMYLQVTMEAIRNAQMEREFSVNKEAGTAFLAENATKEGVVTLPSGLQYRIVRAGKGATPAASDVVRVHYRGTLLDGTEFDSSYKRNEPAEFGVTQVIPGWTEALQLMPVGSKWELFIPENLAYGSADRGAIRPFSTLIFEVELLDIVK
ncbi:MAG: FKBP-type peptidyl-prolyl cis-trans isomerase [Dysgonamonadaceae bacterium]|jgi:FKBP-type peptidyl-prolyl cis-trans isomerase FklB|nr:FKBP-type peptidyl-prolyl cis-trans isomerase [Dysgonamonadaceae bacterium]